MAQGRWQMADGKHQHEVALTDIKQYCYLMCQYQYESQIEGCTLIGPHPRSFLLPQSFSLWAPHSQHLPLSAFRTTSVPQTSPKAKSL